jgi:diguanylate cyclase (GGDEF)-like protein/PAS domain S-box-containing protein
MADSNNFYKELLDNLFDGVYFVDRNRLITYWNKGAERITGYSADQVIGHSCRDNLLNHVTANGIKLCSGQCPLAACMVDGNVREADVFLHHAEGYRLPVFVRAAPIRDPQGNIVGAVETFNSDQGMISVRKQLRELRHMVRTDALTNVSNRRAVETQLRAALGESSPSIAAGLLFIDIDNFKQVNDTYGHEVGDQVLVMVAATLKHNLRKSDIIGRWGGEEFLVILHDLEGTNELLSLAEKLRMLVECSRLDLPNFSLTVTISVGATLLSSQDTLESVVKRADELMYQSKQAGRNRISIQ